jgi:hypothetical protein
MRRNSRLISTLTIGAALALAPVAPAFADHNFQTPSGNISCEYNSYSDADGNAVDAMGCIVFQIKLGTAAEGVCDPDSDRVVGFLVANTGRAGYGCFDPAEFDDSVVLPYGRSFRKAGTGVTCTAAKSGLTCRNLSRHGFKIARGAQSIF